MSLKYALLGFLNYADMTGYELKQHFDSSIQHFWNAKLSQIYPALSQMEKDGLLVMEVEYQEQRPNRKVYKITAAGRQELKRWVGTTMELQSVREAFLVQVFFMAQLDRESALGVMRHQLEQYRKRLENYHLFKKSFSEVVPAEVFKEDAVFWELTLDAGIKYGTAAVEWVEEAIEKIKGMERVKGGLEVSHDG
ncbi:MAG TPA: hypothetical protein DEF36_17105 [Desulfotomaculum sp.]|nr:hypothetical protein [Desulfotomaculum sp.]